MNATELTTLLSAAPITKDRIGEPERWGSGKKREIESTWIVGAGNTDPNDDRFGDDGTIVIDLTTYHHGSNKRYSSTLRVSIEGAMMKQTTIAFGARNESSTVLSDPVARFSAKTMREHHALALALVKQMPSVYAQSIAGGVAQYLPSTVNA